MRLFVERARATRPDFALSDENAGAVAAICRRLDGLPLALELAAARLKLFTPAALLGRLGRRLEVLTGGAQDLPERQRTLRGAIGWSYDLLAPGERAFFHRLGVFSGGWDLEAAAAVCGGVGAPGTDILDGLTALVDSSLVVRAEPVAGAPRFVLLETLREYALERLAECGETDDVRRRHAAYYIALAEGVAPDLVKPQQLAALTRLEAEHDNVRQAFRWAAEHDAAESALRLGWALIWFWLLHGHLSEGRARISAALALPSAALPMQTTWRARNLAAAAWLAYYQADHAVAVGLAQEAASLAGVVGEAGVASFALAIPAAVRRLRGEGDRGEALAIEQLALARSAGDSRLVALATYNVATAALELGDAARAADLLPQCLAATRACGERGLLTAVLNTCGRFAWEHGDATGAQTLLEESLALSRELGDRWRSGATLAALATLAVDRGDRDAAQDLYGEALAIQRASEFGSSKQAVAAILDELGALAEEDGDYPGAHALYREGLDLRGAPDAGDDADPAESLERFAGLAAAQGDARRAVRLASAAALRRPTAWLPFRIERIRPRRSAQRRSLEAALRALGQRAGPAAAAQGQAMSLEQAMADALSTEAAHRSAKVVAAGAPEPASIYPPAGRRIEQRRTEPPADGLTSREMEVLRLIAAGRSNQQIAQALVLSVRTVERHIANVYTKIGVHGRAEATAYAFRQCLV